MAKSSIWRKRLLALVTLLCLVLGAHWLFRRYVYYVVDLGALPDSTESRVLLVKTFVEALESNRTAKEVGITWRFTTGTHEGSRLAVRFRRDTGSLYARSSVASGYCSTTAPDARDLPGLIRRTKMGAFRLEYSNAWDPACVSEY